MERYMGCDVHARSCTLSVRSATGKRLRREVVETSGEALVAYLQRITGNLHLCIEESEWSQWLAEILTPYVAELVVWQPEWKPGSKSDAIDADELSERIRTGDLGRVVFKDRRGQFTALRELVRAYAMITRDVVRTKNRLKSFYRGRGVRCGGEAVYHPEKRAELVAELPPATRRAVALLGRELEGLEGLKEEAEAAMVRESHRYPISRILETAPGLGTVRVAQLLPIVVTPHRFRTKRQFWSYCGFGIVTRSSSDWVLYDGRWLKAPVVQTRGLSAEYNRKLKTIFKGAATTMIAHARPNPLREDYDRLLANGTKPNLAKLTIARKIAAIVLAMWKREERYQPGK
jgi:transposase